MGRKKLFFHRSQGDGQPVKQLSEALNLSEILVKTVLDKSIENGLVEAYGAGRGRNYILSHNLFQGKSKSIGYVRQKDIDETRYTELIMNKARNNEFISRADVMNLLHAKASKAYGLLKKLAEEGLLIPVNKGRYAKYKIK